MPIILIDAPSNLGLKRPAADHEPGTRFAPWQLRQLDLLARLGAEDGGAAEPPAYSGERDPDSGILHSSLLAPYAVQLADLIGAALARDGFPLVLGGDCSIALGSALAMRRRGRHGLLFLDGHRDLLRAQDSRSGGAAGMDLALITGHGPNLLTRIDGHLPLVDPVDVLLFGHRDDDRWYSPPLLELAESSMRSIGLQSARQQDIDRVFARRLGALLDSGVDGFWIHLDVDVLDDLLMSAVDARQPEGMTAAEVERLLQAALASGRCRGLHVSNYDPERDPGLACGRALVEILVAGLQSLHPEALARAAEAPAESLESEPVEDGNVDEDRTQHGGDIPLRPER
jgi:arginase